MQYQLRCTWKLKLELTFLHVTKVSVGHNQHGKKSSDSFPTQEIISGMLGAEKRQHKCLWFCVPSILLSVVVHFRD